MSYQTIDEINFTNLVVNYLRHVDDKTRVDLDVMMSDLQCAFPEYSMCPDDSFKAHLEAAYLRVLEVLGLRVSRMRPRAPSPPTFSWANMGANPDGQHAKVRQDLQEFIRRPFPSPFPNLLIERQISNSPIGILLHGPSDCGKTMMVRTLGAEFGGSFISIKCPELVNPYIMNETETAISMAFQSAKDCAPCIFFLDDIDVLCRKNTSGEDGDDRSVERASIQNILLHEMEALRLMGNSVHLLAATNKRNMIETAFLRDDKFRSLFINYPQPLDRVDILRTITKNGTNPPVAHDVNLVRIGSSDELNRFTGADLQKLVQEARWFASRNALRPNPVINKAHFDLAILKIKESKWG